MRFLRRNSAATDDSTARDATQEAAGTPQSKGYTPAKGRPTPKRRETETRRRGPISAPRTQREAYRKARGNKEDRRKAADDRRERMMSGDDRYLMPRDRGPVKAYARDIIDSRRNLMGLFMPLAIVVLVAFFIPQEYALLVQQYLMLFCTVILAAMIVEAIILGRIVTRRVRAKFPNEKASALTLTWYSFSRASQVRKLRVPRPKTKPGDTV